MAIKNLQPTLFVTPNLGDTAMNSPSTTGHANTSITKNDGTSQSASCRWHTFQGAGGQVLNITLKLTYNIDGSLDFLAGGNEFLLQYSINGGANWINIFDSFVAGPTSDSPSISIPANTPISQIQVRDFIQASSGIFEGFPTLVNIQAAVSGIRLEVDVSNPGPICIW